MISDAELQGLAVIRGKGLELVLTLGTGAGTGLLRDGELMPHLELAHHVPLLGVIRGFHHRHVFENPVLAQASNEIRQVHVARRHAVLFGQVPGPSSLHQEQLDVLFLRQLDAD